MIKSLKFGSVGGGGGVKILFHPLLGGGAKPNISFFLGDSGNLMHFVKFHWLLGGGTDPLIHTCVISMV